MCGRKNSSDQSWEQNGSHLMWGQNAVYANYIGLSVMTDANCEGFPI